jgi:hypothetical protein
MQYTTTDFIAAITRELAKRSEAYPRIVKKKMKQWIDRGEDVNANVIDLTTAQRIQYELMEELKRILPISCDTPIGLRMAIFRELQRELRMRKTCYPRWVRFGRMEQEVAFTELEVWNALVKYFHEVYVPDEPWRKPATRTKTNVHG